MPFRISFTPSMDSVSAKCLFENSQTCSVQRTATWHSGMSLTSPRLPITSAGRVSLLLLPSVQASVPSAPSAGLGVVRRARVCAQRRRRRRGQRWKAAMAILVVVVLVEWWFLCVAAVPVDPPSLPPPQALPPFPQPSLRPFLPSPVCSLRPASPTVSTASLAGPVRG